MNLCIVQLCRYTMAKKRIIRALSVPKVKFADVHQSENAEAVRCNLSIVDELNHSSRCQTNSNGRGSAMLNKRHSLVTSDMSINDYVTADENLENGIERKTSQTRGDYQYRVWKYMTNRTRRILNDSIFHLQRPFQHVIHDWAAASVTTKSWNVMLAIESEFT